MPGICGIIDQRPATSLPSPAAMIGPLHQHSWFVDEQFATIPGVWMAAVSLEVDDWRSKVAVSTDSQCVCGLDVESYRRDALRTALVRVTTSDLSTDAELLLAGWSEKGPSFLRELHGSFSAVIWDQRQQIATLMTDRFGSHP